MQSWSPIKKLWFQLGAELAIKSLTLISDVFTSTILVPLNHAMHMKSKVVRELGAEIESYKVSYPKYYIYFTSHIFIPKLTLLFYI